MNSHSDPLLENIIEAVAPTVFVEIVVVGEYNALFELSLKRGNWSPWQHHIFNRYKHRYDRLEWYKTVYDLRGEIEESGLIIEDLCFRKVSIGEHKRYDIEISVDDKVLKVFYIDQNGCAHEQPIEYRPRSGTRGTRRMRS